LRFLEEKAAQEGIVYTEAQLVALEAAKRERESHPDEILRKNEARIIARAPIHFTLHSPDSHSQP
jgi:hypothetical protein